jgi:hypothetical protein
LLDEIMRQLAVVLRLPWGPTTYRLKMSAIRAVESIYRAAMERLRLAMEAERLAMDKERHALLVLELAQLRQRVADLEALLRGTSDRNGESAGPEPAGDEARRNGHVPDPAP